MKVNTVLITICESVETMRINNEVQTLTITDKKVLTKYVAAFLLGDGCLIKGKECVNARYTFAQRADHKDYVDWQISILQNITSISLYENPEHIQSQGAVAKRTYQFDTKVHPFFTTIYERFYICGKKTVSPHDLKLLDWESIAIWYMDDGYLYKKNDRPLRLDQAHFCTDCYSYGDVVLLRNILHEKFGLLTGLWRRKLKDSYGYRITISTQSMNLFINSIKPFIFPSFQYKLKARMNDSSIKIEDDEIVQSLSKDEESSRNEMVLDRGLE